MSTSVWFAIGLAVIGVLLIVWQRAQVGNYYRNPSSANARNAEATMRFAIILLSAAVVCVSIAFFWLYITAILTFIAVYILWKLMSTSLQHVYFV